MRLQLVSDCHLEWHRDEGFGLLLDITATAEEVDILVVAGDFATRGGLDRGFSTLCQHFAHVVTVFGNHEFYGSDRETILKEMEAVRAKNPNLHLLDRSAEPIVTIEGQRFVGCPLWFKFDPENTIYQPGMNDFRVIRGFRGWVYDENEADMNFLRDNVKADDVVVTHYLPAEESVSPRFKGNVYNRFFLCDMREVMVFGGPKLWVHGHTHDSCDYHIGETRVVCNPFGYKDHEENPEWRANLVLEV